MKNGPVRITDRPFAVLRHLTVKMKAAVTSPSPMMKEEKSKSMMPGDAAPAEAAAA